MERQRSGNCCGPTGGAPDGRGMGKRGETLPVLNKGCCGGRDYGPVRDDEGPSDSDLAMFNRETVDCPKCKAEMFDEAEMCLSCGHLLVAEDRKGLPPWAVGTGVLLIGVLTLWVVL